MKSFVTILFLCITAAQSFPQEAVYFAQSIGDKGIILEDHITTHNNADSWGKSQYGMNYEGYTNYIKDIVKKYSAYNDTVREYFLTDYKPEFEKLTNIKIGDRFYISSEKDVYLSEVTGYYIRMDDEIGGGNIFYELLTNPKESNEADVSFSEYELLVCTKNGNMSKIDRTGITDASARNNFKKLIIPKLKKVKVMDPNSRANKWDLLLSIDDEDLKIFSAPLTNAAGSDGKLLPLNLLSFAKAVAPTEFASGVWILDETGKVLKEFSKLKEKDFNYMKVTGIVDIDGDGIYEIITEDGYYEGAGYGLWKFNKDKFDYIASGFAFGV